ncbi:hypothetical protein ACA910_021620 [Epithemia clementina (nom. ined.)]
MAMGLSTSPSNNVSNHYHHASNNNNMNNNNLSSNFRLQQSSASSGSTRRRSKDEATCHANDRSSSSNYPLIARTAQPAQQVFLHQLLASKSRPTSDRSSSRQGGESGGTEPRKRSLSHHKRRIAPIHKHPAQIRSTLLGTLGQQQKKNVERQRFKAEDQARNQVVIDHSIEQEEKKKNTLGAAPAEHSLGVTKLRSLSQLESSSSSLSSSSFSYANATGSATPLLRDSERRVTGGSSATTTTHHRLDDDISLDKPKTGGTCRIRSRYLNRLGFVAPSALPTAQQAQQQQQQQQPLVVETTTSSVPQVSPSYAERLKGDHGLDEEEEGMDDAPPVVVVVDGNDEEEEDHEDDSESSSSSSCSFTPLSLETKTTASLIAGIGFSPCSVMTIPEEEEEEHEVDHPHEEDEDNEGSSSRRRFPQKCSHQRRQSPPHETGPPRTALNRFSGAGAAPKRSGMPLSLDPFQSPPQQPEKKYDDYFRAQIQSHPRRAAPSPSKNMKKKKHVSFDTRVTVHPIPHHLAYSKRFRQVLWTSSEVMRRLAARNCLEFASDNWDWRQAANDEDLVYCQGEWWHPVHFVHSS